MEEKKTLNNDLLLTKNTILSQSGLFGLVQDYSNPKHIPYKDKMFLTPTEKYRIYGKFPVRMVLDIILIILITIQIVMINGSTSSYTRAVERLFNDIFLQNDSPYDVDFPRLKYLYTMDEIINHVKQSRNGFFNLKNISIGNLTLEDPDDYIKILIYFFNGRKRRKRT